MIFGGPLKFVALAWTYIKPAVLVILGLVLIPSARGFSAALAQARGRLEDATVAILILGMGGVLALSVLASTTHEVEPTVGITIGAVTAGLAVWIARRWRHQRGRPFADVVAPAFFFSVAMSVTIIYSAVSDTPQGLPDDRWRAGARVLLTAGYAGFVAAAAGAWQARGGRTPNTPLRVAVALNLIIGLMASIPVFPGLIALVPFWVTANFAVGFVLLFSTLKWGGIRSALQRVGITLEISDQTWRIIGVVALVLAVVLVIAQWGWSAYLAQSIWWRLPIEKNASALLTELRNELFAPSPRTTWPKMYCGVSARLSFARMRPSSPFGIGRPCRRVACQRAIRTYAILDASEPLGWTRGDLALCGFRGRLQRRRFRCATSYRFVTCAGLAAFSAF